MKDINIQHTDSDPTQPTSLIVSGAHGGTASGTSPAVHESPSPDDPGLEPGQDEAGSSLSESERKSLEKHERAIGDALRSWVDEAGALASIKAEKLWRGAFESFEDYALQRWEIKRARAYQLTSAYDLVTSIKKSGAEVPVSESHIRGLTKLDRPVALALWDKILAKAGNASQVKRATTETALDMHKSTVAEETVSSGGRLVLTQEAQGQIDAEKLSKDAKNVIKSDVPPPQPLPLVTVPPEAVGLDASFGPAIVTSKHVDGFDPESITAMRDLFKTHYAKKGKAGPKMNMTNDHVGWALWTLNPVTGCTWTCLFCYAREIAKLRYPQGFVPTVHPERLLAPKNTKVPERYAKDPAARRVFLGSQADWMDPSFPDPVIHATLKMCRDNPEWEFMTLTKQPERLVDFEFPDNVWVGVTVCRQGQVAPAEEAFARVEAAVRWVSFEPLHGSVVLSRPNLVDLYVIGAERKTNQRMKVKETKPEWVDALRLQARSVGASIWEKENLNARLREMPTPRRESAAGDGTDNAVQSEVSVALPVESKAAPDRSRRPRRHRKVESPAELSGSDRQLRPR